MQTPRVSNLTKYDEHTQQVTIVVRFVRIIYDVMGSNLGWDNDYPDRFFVCFLSPSRQILG
jgi:hypothetical protein